MLPITVIKNGIQTPIEADVESLLIPSMGIPWYNVENITEYVRLGPYSRDPLFKHKQKWKELVT